MWGTFLSEPLSIVGLVGRYPANCLMERMPIYQRWIFNKYSHAGPLFYGVLIRLSPGYPPLIGKLHTRYSPVRRSPSICIATNHAAPRLACVKPVASVHPEPGSNSSLFKLFYHILAPESVYRSPKSYFYWRYRSGKFLFLILVLLVELCKSLKELLSLSFLDCGCKGKDFFLTSKFFGEKFSSFFSQADLRAVGNYRLAQPTSSPTQGYLHVSIISEAPFSLECGCKSNAIKHTVQIYRALFFKFFFTRGIAYVNNTSISILGSCGPPRGLTCHHTHLKQVLHEYIRT